MTLWVGMLLCLFVPLSVIQAEETASGGQVSSTSKITFFEGDLKPDILPKTILPKTLAKALPQTSEGKSNAFWLGGLLVIVTSLLFFWRRRRKEAIHEA